MQRASNSATGFMTPNVVQRDRFPRDRAKGASGAHVRVQTLSSRKARRGQGSSSASRVSSSSSSA